jgi:aminocarboxymuconate-semialdehyde decarboxylase
VYRTAVADGARGAALGTSVAGRRLDEPDFERFWAIANEIGLPVLLHPAFNEPHRGLEPWYLQNVIGNPLETTVAVERLLCRGVLHRNPKLRLVLLHGGGTFPYQMGRLRHARAVRPDLENAPADILAPISRLYFDTITHDTTALRFLEHQVGEGNVVLGTDMPFDMAPKDPMAEIREAFTPDSVRRITEDNPDALFAQHVSGS